MACDLLAHDPVFADELEALPRVLAHRQPQLDVRYTEIPGYGRLDPFSGRGAALDVFGRILDFPGERR